MTTVIQRVTQVRRGEAAAVVTSALCFFFILTALMVLRPAREALGMRRGIEAVRWLFVGTAVVTLAVNPVFALLVSRTRRLVFITATNDRKFRAFDAKTGKELWAAPLDLNSTAVPMTYQGKDGKQYVAVVVANGTAGPQQQLVVYSLP